MKEGHNDWGHTIDNDDPNQGYVDDPSRINEIINQQMDGSKKTGRSVNRAALYENEQEGRRNTNYGGYTVDDDDPIQGYVDPNNPEALREAHRMLEEKEAEERRRKEKQQLMASGHNLTDALVEEEEPEEVADEVAREVAKEPTEQDRKLAEVFKKGMEIRDRYKDPGNPRYRLLSVAAVEMEPIDQGGEAAEKVNSINKAVEKAAKAAVGGEEMDDYSGDTVAGVQAYIVEDLIGDDADQVSIGTAETIVNPNGQIGKDPEIYKNLVVVRWIKNGTNHVFVFSPRKDAAMYALVDDSMGDSWKKTFLMAGAVNGDERHEIMSVNHDQSGDGYLHEKTLEKMIVRMMQKKEAEVMNTEGMSFENKAKALLSISKEYDRLAHLTGQTLKGNSPSQTESEKEITRSKMRESQDEKDG